MLNFSVMNSGSRSQLIRQMVMFGMVGVVNTAVGLAVVFGLMWYFGVSPYISNFAGHVVGVCVSFVLNSIFTFRSAVTLMSGVRFFCAFLISLVCNMLVLKICLFTDMNPMWAQLVAMSAYTLIFFVASRSFVFVGAKE